LVDVFAGWNSALHFNHQTREEEQKPATHLESIFTFNFNVSPESLKKQQRWQTTGDLRPIF
jgi:hypothetical protein